MKSISRFLKAILNAVAFMLGIKGDTRREAVDDGICDYSGQGRDEF